MFRNIGADESLFVEAVVFESMICSRSWFKVYLYVFN